MTRGNAGLAPLALIALLFFARSAGAQLIEAEPVSPVVAPFPADAPAIETQVALQLVIDPTGSVESAVEISRLPRDAPGSGREIRQTASSTAATLANKPVYDATLYIAWFQPLWRAPVNKEEPVEFGWGCPKPA